MSLAPRMAGLRWKDKLCPGVIAEADSVKFSVTDLATDSTGRGLERPGGNKTQQFRMRAVWSSVWTASALHLSRDWPSEDSIETQQCAQSRPSASKQRGVSGRGESSERTCELPLSL